MNPRAALLSATLLCLATALAACGGSSPSSFATSAIQACTAYYNEAYALPPPIGVTQLEAYPEKQQALREQELSKLQALTPPATARGAYTRYLSGVAALDDLYASAIASIKTPHSTRVQALARQAPELQARLKHQAQALGLSECAKDPYTATHYSNS